MADPTHVSGVVEPLAAAVLQPGAAVLGVGTSHSHASIGVEPLGAVLLEPGAGAGSQASTDQGRSMGAAGQNSANQSTSSSSELPTRTEAENVGLKSSV